MQEVGWGGGGPGWCGVRVYGWEGGGEGSISFLTEAKQKGTVHRSVPQVLLK